MSRCTQALLLVALVVPPVSASAQTVDCAEPNVLLLFDVSGSMGKALPGTKYTLATAALTGATLALDDEVRFGLLMFPEPTQAPAVHCDLETQPQIMPALGNGQAIFDLIDASGANFWGGPTGDHDTPMFQALQAAGQLAELLDLERRSYVVLITDGKQDCCIAGDYDDEPDCLPNSTEFEPTEEAENVVDLVQQVAFLKAAGIQTYVVGLQEKVSPLALNKMAMAGGTASPNCNPNQTDPLAADNCYLPTSDAASLENALSEIAQLISEETCDGIDNDCDGETDELWPTLFDLCDGDDADACANGLTVCTDDMLSVICDESGVGATEVCNGLDDDCDGKIDELWPLLGHPCDGDDADFCDDGITVCTPDLLGAVCNETGSGYTEECNGADDDCDGETDEGNPCPAGYQCLGGKCMEDGVDNPGDLDPTDEDAGSTADAQDQPNNPDSTGSGGGDVQDRPAPNADAGTGQGSTGAGGGDLGLLGLPDSQGGGFRGPSAPTSDDTDGGCGCRTAGSDRPLPSGGGLIVVIFALAVMRRRLIMAS